MKTDEVGKAGTIKSIFLAEFHPKYGPKISCQYPIKDGISKEIFDNVSVFIIPKPEIQKRIITVNVLGHKIIGYPNEIENPKYARNALKFNLCFVFGSETRTVHYEPIIKKLSEYLENLELENGFLSNDDTKQDISNIMEQIFSDLNANAMCTIEIKLRERKPSSSNTAPSLESKPPNEKNERRPTMLSEYKRSDRTRMERRQTMMSRYRSDDAIKGERRCSMVDRKDEKEISFRTIRKCSDPEGKSRRASDADTYLKCGKKSAGDIPEKRGSEIFHSLGKLFTNSKGNLNVYLKENSLNFRCKFCCIRIKIMF